MNYEKSNSKATALGTHCVKTIAMLTFEPSFVAFPRVHLFFNRAVNTIKSQF